VLAPIPTFFGKRVLTVKDAINDLDDRGYKYSPGKYPAHSDYAARLREDKSWMTSSVRKSVGEMGALHNHRLRKHNEEIKTRFRLYQCLYRNGIPSKVLNIPSSDKTAKGKATEIIRAINGAKFPMKSPDGVVIAKGRKQLVKLINELPTKKHSQRPLDAKKPSPTVLSLPDDFVHPFEPRTMTVREMARFQSFPDAFEFRAKETTGSLRRRFEVPQYTQVGNAVAPLLAYELGKHIKNLLTSNHKKSVEHHDKKEIVAVVD